MPHDCAGLQTIADNGRQLLTVADEGCAANKSLVSSPTRSIGKLAILMTQVEAQAIATQLFPASPSSITFIDKGYSNDRKFLLQVGENERYLLRLSSLEEAGIRQREFDAVTALYQRGIPCSEPIQFGCDERTCYGLYRYIEGECAFDELPKMTTSQQYDVGLIAGANLKAIHHALEPTTAIDAYEYRDTRFRRYRQLYLASDFRFDGDDLAFEYVEANLELLRDRPTVFRHGDYHPGNLIVDQNAFKGIIDFNRCDWGDPIDDFYKLAYFGAPLSADFARGQLTGYFKGEPPTDFWPIYNLYVAAVLTADLIWTQTNFPHQIPDSLRRIALIINTYDFKEGSPPLWWQ